MWCLVVLPNSVVLDINVDSKAKGQECLDKVCEQFGIIETDYFGLQYAGSKGEQLWLNMRNRISRQLPGTAPYRLSMRVKFFVQPHFLLQETTRHVFYMQVKQQFQNDGLRIPDPDQMAKISALISQAEHGDCTRTQHHATSTAQMVCACEHSPCIPNSTELSTELHTAITHNHSQLSGLSKASAEYRMLQEVSSLNCYGVEHHLVRNSASLLFHMGVGPEGIALYDKEWNVIKSIAYPTVQMATHAGKCVFLHTLQDDGKCLILGFKLVSQKAANGLYRCVTEMHSFYRCDTVRNAVAAQFSRDLKGTLASLFNENTTLGKKYVFDIKRTCREAYDHARRRLYTQGQPTTPVPPISPTDTTDMDCTMDHSEGHDLCSAKCQELKEQLEHIQDELLCRVCMDADIDTAFCPCGHLVCCSSCAERLESCPVCRSHISQMQHIFLPKLKTAATSTSVSTDTADEEGNDEAVAMATIEDPLPMETAS